MQNLLELDRSMYVTAWKKELSAGPKNTYSNDVQSIHKNNILAWSVLLDKREEISYLESLVFGCGFLLVFM